MSERIANPSLDDQIATAMTKLNSRQREFALILGQGGENQKSAAIRAGYAEKRAEVWGSRLMTNVKVKSAVELIRRKNQLAHGIEAAWKRQKLVDIANQAATPGELYQPSVAVRAINELNQMDGHHAALEVKHNHLKVNVSLDYKIDMPERAIEGEIIKKIEGHDDE